MARTPRTTEDKLKIVMNDPKLWLLNFVKIIDAEGKSVPFALNPQQEYFLNNIDTYNIILKSRKQGFSTFALGYMLYYACTRANTTCLMISYSSDSVQNLFETLKYMYATIPDKYKPKEIRSNRTELKLENGSRIIVKTAGNKDLGRGYSCQYIHLSEFAFWTDSQQERGLVALEESLSKNRDARIVIETTANGYNDFQKIFMKAYKGQSKYKAFFFPFYAEATKKQFKHEIDKAIEWYKLNNHGTRLSANDLTPDEKLLHEKGCTLNLLMWRQYRLQDTSLQDFQQEFPATVEEAFQNSSTSIFDIRRIVERQNNLYPPVKINDLTKPLPDVLKAYMGKGLFIYRQPKPKMRYYLGVDTSAGGGGDYSAISVFDADGEQVAAFYDNKIPPYQFARVVYDLGMYYNYGLLVVERNSYGLSIIERVRKDMHYQNMYKHRTFDERGKRKTDIGWNTTNVTKAKLITDFKEQFEVGLININDNETLEQMQIFIQDDRGRLRNIRNDGVNHDDLVIASALAIQGMKDTRWYVAI